LREEKMAGRGDARWCRQLERLGTDEVRRKKMDPTRRAPLSARKREERELGRG
jgi:hypothetical protein